MRESGSIGVGIIGAGWMGHVHARSYARMRHHFPTGGRTPILVAVADPVPDQLSDFRSRFAPPSAYGDWRDLLADPRIEAVSVTAPNHLHGGIGCAVAASGRHLWIEKPVGLGLADTESVAAAVARAGVVCRVGFNYRNVPAVARARELIAAGGIGRPTHARVRLFTDYAAHPGGTLSWRYELARGGHGVLGDLASHGVDMIRFLLGDVTEVVAVTDTFIGRRPVAEAGTSHYAVIDAEGSDVVLGDVENEDFVAAIFRTVHGVPVTLEASRTAVGDQNNYGFEVHGTRGLVGWDFRRSDELAVSSGSDFQAQPTHMMLSGPGDGEYAAFQPGAGIAMGYDDTKVIEAFAFMRAIMGEDEGGATIDDAVASARALEAVVVSAASRTWVRVAAG